MKTTFLFKASAKLMSSCHASFYSGIKMKTSYDILLRLMLCQWSVSVF